MRKTSALILISGLLLAACGEAPSVSGSSTPTTPPETTTEPTTTVAPTSTTAAPLATYRYTMTYSSTDDDGSEERFVITGAVDADRSIGEIRFVEADDEPLTVIVQSPAGVAMQAPSSDFLPSDAGEIDPTQWYDIDPFEEDGLDAFFLDSTPTAASVWELIGVEPERSSSEAGVVERALIDEADLEPHWGTNTLFDVVGRSVESLELITESDAAGTLNSVAFNSVDPDEEGSISIVIVDRGAPVDIFVPEETVPVPTEERRPPLTLTPTTLTPPAIVPGVDGVLFRLSTTGGWGLPEKPARQLSLTADGELVRIINPDVFVSTDEFTVLHISSAGVERLVAVIEDSGLLEDPRLADGRSGVSPTDITTTLWLQGRPVLSMDRVGQVDGYTDEQLEAREQYSEVIALLEDPSWLGDDMIGDWEPWMPETLTVFAGDVSTRSGLPPNSPFAPWPLDASIEELASGTTLNPYEEEELVVCLTGDQVAPVWALMTGVNSAYMRVDDGTEWELNYILNWPGYRQSRDVC